MHSGSRSDNQVVVIARRFHAALLVIAVICCACLILAILLPLSVSGRSEDQGSASTLRAYQSDAQDINKLVAGLARANLIRPARVQAAVKDDGRAQRLLKSLKLQGIVQQNGNLVAYIEVEKSSTQVVSSGDKLLEFVVEKIESGRVTLTLDGVAVVLAQ